MCYVYVYVCAKISVTLSRDAVFEKLER